MSLSVQPNIDVTAMQISVSSDVIPAAAPQSCSRALVSNTLEFLAGAQIQSREDTLKIVDSFRNFVQEVNATTVHDAQELELSRKEIVQLQADMDVAQKDVQDSLEAATELNAECVRELEALREEIIREQEQSAKIEQEMQQANKAELDGLTAQNQSLHQDVVSLSKEMTKARDEAAKQNLERNNKWSALKRSNESAINALKASHQAAISGANGTIQALNGSVAHLNQVIANNNAVIGAKDQKIAQLRTQLSRYTDSYE